MSDTIEQARELLQQYWGHESFLPYQQEVIESALSEQDTLAVMRTGCHEKGQGILLADGTIRLVEDIKPGDQLMGMDGSIRNVKRLIRGEGRLYRIIPVKGKSFVVNEDHILTLVRTNTTNKSKWPFQRRDLERRGETTDVSVREYLRWNKMNKHLYKLFRSPVVSFKKGSLKHSKLGLSPYFVGLLLGDGSLGTYGNVSITTMNYEAAKEAEKFAKQHNARLRVRTKDGNKASTYHIHANDISGRAGSKHLSKLKIEGLLYQKCDEKHVPFKYKTARYSDRMELLAGLIESDGELDYKDNAVFISKSYNLACDVAFISRSLGFAAYLRSVKKRATNTDSSKKEYYQVSISGGLSSLPFRFKETPERNQKKNPLRTGFSIEYEGYGNYYGFVLDGDGRYLLDDFTVTHNSGKTATFQIPALAKPGSAIVISPLISLMQDQVYDCQQKGIAADYINSTQTHSDQQEKLSEFVDGSLDLLYVAPERIRSKSFIEAVKETTINYLVVDEAHSIELEGAAFRPSYLNIPVLLKHLPNRPPIIALTATATRSMMTSIANKLHMDRPQMIMSSPIRDNFVYNTFTSGNSWQNVVTCAKAFSQRDGQKIIYCCTRKACEKVADILKKELTDHRISYYHGGMQGSARRNVQQDFKNGKLDVVCATNAFGMGIDMPHIRDIVHMGIPGSLEDYVQQSGRAGRDGARAYVTLIYDDYSHKLREQFLDDENPPWSVYEPLWQWLHDNIEEGEKEKIIPEVVANDISARGRRVTQKEVQSAIDIMEAHGAVQRSYGFPVPRYQIRRSKLSNLRAKAAAKSVANYLMNKSSRSQRSEVNVYPSSFAKQLGLSVRQVNAALEHIENSGGIKLVQNMVPEYVKVRHYGVELSDIVSKADIDRKRNQDENRLQWIVDYAHASDPVQCIKDYFEVD